jgi:hypothetical protein
MAENVLKNTDFRLSESSLTFNIRSSKFSATIKNLTKFDVPMKVQLAKKPYIENPVESSSSDSKNVEKTEERSARTSNLFLEFFSDEENDRPAKRAEIVVDEKISKSIESDILKSVDCVDLTLDDDLVVANDRPEKLSPKKIDRSSTEKSSNLKPIDQQNKQKKKRIRKPRNKDRKSLDKSTDCKNVQTPKSVEKVAPKNKVQLSEQKLTSPPEKFQQSVDRFFKNVEQKSFNSAKDRKNSEMSSTTKTDENVFAEVDEGDVMNEICIIFEQKNNSRNEAKSPRKNLGVKNSFGISKDVTELQQKSDSSLPVSTRKRSRSDSEDQPLEKKPKVVENKVSSPRKSVDKLKVKLSEKNRKRLSDTENANLKPNPISASPKPPNSETPKGTISSQEKKIGKTKKLLKPVDPNQKSILQYFLSSSNPL